MLDNQILGLLMVIGLFQTTNQLVLTCIDHILGSTILTQHDHDELMAQLDDDSSNTWACQGSRAQEMYLKIHDGQTAIVLTY
jgi:hypothetical protein